VRVGLQLPSFTFPGGAAAIRPTLTEIAQGAEANGFASLWVMDHLFQLPEDTGLGGPEQPMLEAYTTLGFLAQATQHIALGPMVASAVLRPPGLLVKAATTLDVLAGDRPTYFAVGAAWYERESIGLGLPYPPRGERFEHLEETLRIARSMFAGDRSPIEGRHHRLAEPINVPPPLSRPRIMVGGGGERKTLRLVAEYADACNILVPDPGESRHKLEVLARHCAAIGRDVAEIETTSLLEADLRPGRQSPTDVIAAFRAQADEGIEHVIVNLPDAYRADRLETFGREIIPAVA
jgi:alkanesulfonate monooxygenase SsuD/methylene tetrahydromethanopterin reductase-like flavin-dependent oxidoreductase (luciferase family)